MVLEPSVQFSVQKTYNPAWEKGKWHAQFQQAYFSKGIPHLIVQALRNAMQQFIPQEY